jgi:hypothetical protein
VGAQGFEFVDLLFQLDDRALEIQREGHQETR